MFSFDIQMSGLLFGSIMTSQFGYLRHKIFLVICQTAVLQSRELCLSLSAVCSLLSYDEVHSEVIFFIISALGHTYYSHSHC